MNTAQVWRAAQDRLRQQMTRQQFDTWFGGTWLAADDDGVTRLCVRSTFVKELLETRFRERIVAAIADVTGERSPVEVVVATVPPGEREPARARAAIHTRSGRGTPLRGAAAGTSGSLPDASQTLFELPPPPVPEDLPVLGQRTVRQGETVRATTPPQAPSSARVRSSTPRFTAGPQRSRITTPLARQDTGAGTGGDGSASRQRAARSTQPPHNTEATDTAHDIGSLPRAPRIAVTPPVASYDASAVLPRPRLNSRYTFSTFIVGSANRFAHASSMAVADAPGEAYNPLFLYGGVGLGKTHLLHAIGHATLERNLTVLYVSSETFTNEIIDAIRYRTTDEFRAKYRSVDVLLVDDIQFIAGKDSTEEEFFHTFNSLHEANKQIVICSDRPPKAIVSLAERLRSRFEWGLIADIQPPDRETRIAILLAKAEMMGRAIPDEVVEYLAVRVQSNIRELEGSLNRLIAFAHLQGMPLTVETVKAALANLASDGKPRRVTIGEILDAVADHFRISADDLCGKQRDKHIVVPRQIAMYLMRQETEASLLEIGQALGGRDHSTVLHGCEKINREINDNTALRKEVLAIRQQLLG
ncbi:MAG TPA: chromosomal replication initiator protein DnaA [Ktedonobacterales bacterium]